MNRKAAGVVNATVIRLSVPNLDPITVVMENIDKGIGSLIVQCYDSAWYAWWGGIGDRSIARFIGDVDPDYLANCLMRSAHVKQNRVTTQYVTRIAAAIIDHFKPSNESH